MNFGEFHTYFQICFRISRGNYLQIEKSTCVLQNVLKTDNRDMK